jgi:hypothetical protein
MAAMSSWFRVVAGWSWCSAFPCSKYRTAWACRRVAPPGFRAAPRADFAVTAIRLQSLTPSRLRRCALRLPPGDRRKAHPRRASLAPSMPPNRRCRIGPASAPPQWTGWRTRWACCGRLCECVPSSTLAVLAHHVTKDGSRTSRPASLWSFHATPQDRRRKVRRGVLACRRVVDLARVSGRAGAAFVRGCRAGPVSFRSGSAQGVLVLL